MILNKPCIVVEKYYLLESFRLANPDHQLPLILQTTPALCLIQFRVLYHIGFGINCCTAPRLLTSQRPRVTFHGIRNDIQKTGVDNYLIRRIQ